MATFITDLMNSIFVPGPTPSIIVATNVSFAALQLVLFCLLIATYSIHFVVLSGLCGALWWSINWFVAELRVAQAAEEAKKKQQEEQAAADEGSDTEAETIVDAGAKGGSRSTEVEVTEQVGQLKSRAGPGQYESSAESGTEHSTEDEWEKVSENEKDK